MAKKKADDAESPVASPSPTPAKAKWYRVLEDSFIGDSLRREGEYVQYDGEAGRNLEPASIDDVRKAGIEANEPTEAELENFEANLIERESDLADREKQVETRAQELEQLIQLQDDRAKELDQREADLNAREEAVKEKENPA